MTKIFCDICKREIGHYDTNNNDVEVKDIVGITIKEYAAYPEDHDICTSCYQKVLATIHNMIENGDFDQRVIQKPDNDTIKKNGEKKRHGFRLWNTATEE